VREGVELMIKLPKPQGYRTRRSEWRTAEPAAEGFLILYRLNSNRRKTPMIGKKKTDITAKPTKKNAIISHMPIR
jgi:hypothetical protein